MLKFIKNSRYNYLQKTLLSIYYCIYVIKGRSRSEYFAKDNNYNFGCNFNYGIDYRRIFSIPK